MTQRTKTLAAMFAIVLPLAAATSGAQAAEAMPMPGPQAAAAAGEPAMMAARMMGMMGQMMGMMSEMMGQMPQGMGPKAGAAMGAPRAAGEGCVAGTVDVIGIGTIQIPAGVMLCPMPIANQGGQAMPGMGMQMPAPGGMGQQGPGMPMPQGGAGMPMPGGM